MTDEQQTGERRDEGAEEASAAEQESGQDQEQAQAGGGDTPEGKAEQQTEAETEEGAGQAESDAPAEDDDSEQAKAKRAEAERDKAAETMKEIEENPPEKLEDWPDDKAKYETFGGPEGEHSYAEGPEEEALGPSSLRHHEDGKVSIAGDEVDDPDEYKGEPIPGGPTDPNAPDDSVAAKTKEKMEKEGDADFGEASSDKMDSDFTDGSGNDSDDDAGDGEASDESQASQQSE